MKSIVTILFLFLSAMYMNISATDSDEIFVTVTESDSEHEHKYSDDKGKRSLPNILLCVINFSNRTIDIATSSNIVRYEIWDNSDEMLMNSFYNDTETVEYLAEISGCYQIRIITESHIYVGIINL